MLPQTACKWPRQGQAPQTWKSFTIPNIAGEHAAISKYSSALCLQWVPFQNHFPHYFPFLNSFYRCQYSRKHRLQKDSTCQRQLYKNCTTHVKDRVHSSWDFSDLFQVKTLCQGFIVFFLTTSVLFLWTLKKNLKPEKGILTINILASKNKVFYLQYSRRTFIHITIQITLRYVTAVWNILFPPLNRNLQHPRHWFLSFCHDKHWGIKYLPHHAPRHDSN